MADDVRFRRPGEAPSGMDTVRLFIAWPFVLIPLLWGVAQTVIKSAALFR